MIVGRRTRNYAARAKGLVIEVKYHVVEVADNEDYSRILTGLPPTLNFVHERFALCYKHPIDGLERALVKAEELHRHPYGTAGHALTAGIKLWSGQLDPSGGCGGRNSGRGQNGDEVRNGYNGRGRQHPQQ